MLHLWFFGSPKVTRFSLEPAIALLHHGKWDSHSPQFLARLDVWRPLWNGTSFWKWHIPKKTFLMSPKRRFCWDWRPSIWPLWRLAASGWNPPPPRANEIRNTVWIATYSIWNRYLQRKHLHFFRKCRCLYYYIVCIHMYVCSLECACVVSSAKGFRQNGERGRCTPQSGDKQGSACF